MNAASTTTGSAPPSSTSVLGTASATGSATGTAGPSATTSARPSGKVGAAGRRVDMSGAGLLSGVLLVMIGCF